MAKGAKVGGFGKSHGGADSMKGKLVTSVMSKKMVPGKGKASGMKKGY